MRGQGGKEAKGKNPETKWEGKGSSRLRSNGSQKQPALGSKYSEKPGEKADDQ